LQLCLTCCMQDISVDVSNDERYQYIGTLWQFSAHK
jgi:hypothetical protein